MKSYPRDLTEALVRRFELTPVQCYVYDLLKDFYFYIERAPSTEEIINLFKNSCQDEIQFVVQRYYTNVDGYWVNEEFDQAIRKEQEQIEKNKLISQKRSMAVRSRRDRQKSTKVATSVSTSVDTHVATSEHTYVDTRDATQVETSPYFSHERTSVRTHERSDVISAVSTHVGTGVNENSTSFPRFSTKDPLFSDRYKNSQTKSLGESAKSDLTSEPTLVPTNEATSEKSPNSTLVGTNEENHDFSRSYSDKIEEPPRTCARVTGPDTGLNRTGQDRDAEKELDDIFNVFESYGFIRRSLQKHRSQILRLIEDGLTVKIAQESLQEAKDLKEKRNEKDFRHSIKYALTIVESNLATQRAKREVRKVKTSELQRTSELLNRYEEEERQWQERHNDPQVREGMELLAKVTEELRNEK